MAAQGNSASKALVIVLVVIALVAVLYYAFGRGGDSRAIERDLANVPEVPADLAPVTDEEWSREPSPVDLGGMKGTR